MALPNTLSRRAPSFKLPNSLSLALESSRVGVLQMGLGFDWQGHVGGFVPPNVQACALVLHRCFKGEGLAMQDAEQASGRWQGYSGQREGYWMVDRVLSGRLPVLSSASRQLPAAAGLQLSN